MFGKLPTHGDFVARGLDAEARDAWDHWISAGLAGARERLGEGFEAAHEVAAPWRFVDGPGPLGVGWRAGAMAASVDKAQRRFVIVAMADGLEAAPEQNLPEQLEQAIYDAFTGGWDADRLLGEVESVLSKSAHPREGGNPGVFTDAGAGSEAEEKTWVPAFAGMSGINSSGGVWWSDEAHVAGPAPDALWTRMFPPLSATEAA